MSELLVVVALKDNYTIFNGEEAFVFPERDTYFTSVVEIATAIGIAESGTSEPEISWDTNPWTIKKIDEKFIPEMANIILKSSTADSTKRFKITVDDLGVLAATEVTE